jgi:hypothetical protein
VQEFLETIIDLPPEFIAFDPFCCLWFTAPSVLMGAALAETVAG